MKIAIAYNRMGAKVAEGISSLVKQMGHDFILYAMTDDDYGCTDVIYEAGLELLNNNVDRIIIICGSGINTAMAANKIKGLYAAPCYEAIEAHMAREDYDTNVLCLSDSWLDAETANAIVREWIDTAFQHKDRCDRALRKIRSIEQSGSP